MTHAATDQLREGLSALLDARPDVTAQARQLIHDLGARGALQFRDLLDWGGPVSDDLDAGASARLDKP